MERGIYFRWLILGLAAWFVIALLIFASGHDGGVLHGVLSLVAVVALIALGCVRAQWIGWSPLRTGLVLALILLVLPFGVLRGYPAMTGDYSYIASVGRLNINALFFLAGLAAMVIIGLRADNSDTVADDGDDTDT